MKRRLDTAAALAGNALALVLGGRMIIAAWDVVETVGGQEAELAKVLTAAYVILQAGLLGICLFSVLKSHLAAKKITMYLSFVILLISLPLYWYILTRMRWMF